MSSKCNACRHDTALPFEFKMAFQPIVDLSRGRVWGYEALVRGVNGEPAFSILDQITDDNRYHFDQAARVMAIETAGATLQGSGSPAVDQLHAERRLRAQRLHPKVACCRQAREFPSPKSHVRIHRKRTDAGSRPRPAHCRGLPKIGILDRAGRLRRRICRSGASFAICSRTSSRSTWNCCAIFISAQQSARLSPASSELPVNSISPFSPRASKTTQELTVLRAAGISLFQGYHFARPALMALPPVYGLDGRSSAVAKRA